MILSDAGGCTPQVRVFCFLFLVPKQRSSEIGEEQRCGSAKLLPYFPYVDVVINRIGRSAPIHG